MNMPPHSQTRHKHRYTHILCMLRKWSHLSKHCWFITYRGMLYAAGIHNKILHRIQWREHLAQWGWRNLTNNGILPSKESANKAHADSSDRHFATHQTRPKKTVYLNPYGVWPSNATVVAVIASKRCIQTLREAVKTLHACLANLSLAVKPHSRCCYEVIGIMVHSHHETNMHIERHATEAPSAFLRPE